MRHLDNARAELSTRFYTVVQPDVVLSMKERIGLERALFADGALERDLPEVHPLRFRADDVVSFEFTSERLYLSEAPANHPDPGRIYVTLTKNYAAPRHYKRFLSLSLPPVRKLLETVIHLVPDEQRRVRGECSIHAIRTQGVVVPIWHRDGDSMSPVDWVVSYVVSREGDGGATQLASDRKGREIVADYELRPGQLVMHRDDKYAHYVTPLQPTEVAPSPHRETIIITIRPQFEHVSVAML